MGFLGLFGKKGDLKKHIARVAKKNAQAVDRWASIQALSEAGTEEAVAALLTRFTIRVDPSITDQEEKEAAFQGIVRAGANAVVPVQAFLRKTDAIAWPIRILEHVLDETAVVNELLDLLGNMDTEYARDPQKKVDVLGQLESRPDPRTVEAATPFLEDVNETVRFHAIATIAAQDNVEDAKAALEAAWVQEDSVRAMDSHAKLFVAKGWAVSDAEKIGAVMPESYRLDGDKVVAA